MLTHQEKEPNNTKIREIKKEFIQVNTDSLSEAAGCVVDYCHNSQLLN
jgi:oligoribonuclease NrnB/cAMP/cGMP phosphodiesterase (DHH superfamily)